VDGRIAFEYHDDIYSVSASGGNENKLIDLKAVLASGSLWGIEWSPDGSRLTFRGSPRASSSEEQRIWVADALGSRTISVTQGPRDENPSWLDNEHILFERWGQGGEVRACVVCLPGSKVKCLTRGHVDISPRADATGRTVFFARSEIPRKNINAWLPETHIYALGLDQRCLGRRQLPPTPSAVECPKSHACGMGREYDTSCMKALRRVKSFERLHVSFWP
jgi:Tol biopolymer transport system component